MKLKKPLVYLTAC